MSKYCVRCGTKAFLFGNFKNDYCSACERAVVAENIEADRVNGEARERRRQDALDATIATLERGQLPVLQHSPLLLKKDEVAHASFRSSLMKEVVRREFRGQYAGVSFRVAKGVRVNTGRTRGRSVELGTDVVVEDSGITVVTSHRTVFLGSRKTIELPHPKLVTIEVFSDGLILGSSNRKANVTLSIVDGELAGAFVNAAAQAHLK